MEAEHIINEQSEGRGRLITKKREQGKVEVVIEFTEGYEKRFTEAILKIYENRLREQEKQEAEKEVG